MGLRNHPKFADWTLYDGYYNKEVVTCPVYAKTFGRGNVYLQDNKDGKFMFTCSFGANSDYSYSGCFADTVQTVEQAKAILNKWVPEHLGNARHTRFNEITEQILKQ